MLNMNATLEHMQAQLVAAVLRAKSIQDIADLSRRMSETAGIVAGTMIARRVKDCCPTCASPEGIAVTIHDMVHSFQSYLEEAARATAASLKTDEVAVFKGIELFKNPPKDDPKPEAKGEPATDPIMDAIEKSLADVFGGEVKVIFGGSPLEVFLRANGVEIPKETADKLSASSAHHRTCSCEACLLWWAYAGPEEAPINRYGPFTKAQVNAKQKELGIKETV